MAGVVAAFSGVFIVIITTDYPPYNVLMLSDKSWERNLAAFAHVQLSKALLWLLLSFLSAAVSSIILKVGRLTLHLDQHDDRASIYKHYNSPIILVGILLTLILAALFAFWGFQEAGFFFDHSVPDCIQDLRSCLASQGRPL